MGGVAPGEDPLLGTGRLLVTARSPDRGIEAVMIQRLLQGFRFHHVGMDRGTVGDGADAGLQSILIGIHEKLETEFAGAPVAEGDHVPELPGRVDVKKLEGRLGGMERLEREMEKDRRVLADRVEQHRIGKHGSGLPQHMNALGFQLFEVV